MNDFSEIENELRKLRPAQPSAILFERIEEALAEHYGTSAAADARWSWRRPPWRTPYNWGLGLAATAVLVLFAAVNLERHQQRGEKVAQSSSAPEIGPVLPGSRGENGAARSSFSDRFVPAGATRLVYNTRDEGLQFAPTSGQPLRRLRYQTREAWQWRNPTTGASLRVSYPSEEVVLIPVSGQ
jgi:hypothetical protein